MAATAFFGIGLISLVGHANDAKMVSGVWKYIIFISALIFVIVPAIPSGRHNTFGVIHGKAHKISRHDHPGS